MADTLVAPPGTHVVSFVAADDPAPLSGKVWPFLGAVTVDVTGLLDADGSITGTPGTLITNAVHIARAMMRFGFQQPDVLFDRAGWTHAASRAAAFGYTWDCQFLPMGFGQFQETVFIQSRVNIFAENGQWRAVFRERGPSVGILTANNILALGLTWTPIQSVVSELQVTYGAGVLEQGMVALTSVRGEMVAPGQTAALAMPWVSSRAMAADLTDWWLRIHDHQRRQVSVVYHPSAITLLRMDTVQIDHRLLEPYGGIGLFWRVNAVRLRPDGFVEIIAEEDDGADVIALAGAAAAQATVIGSLTMPILAGTIVAIATMVGVLAAPALLAGTLAAGATVVGSLTGGTIVVAGAEHLLVLGAGD